MSPRSVALLDDSTLRGTLWTLSGRRLVCHCQLSQPCHGDVLIEEFRRVFPDAHDQNDLKSRPPSASVLDFKARLRDEPGTESDSSPNGGVPGKRSGYCGAGEPLSVGVGYTTRDMRWEAGGVTGKVAARSRRYPTNSSWTGDDASEVHGTQWNRAAAGHVGAGKNKGTTFRSRTDKRAEECGQLGTPRSE